LPRVEGGGAEAEREARNTGPDGPFEGEVKAGIVGGAEGFAEQAQNYGDAVGEKKRRGVSDLLCGCNMTWVGVKGRLW
jgi:hypothetical protein